MHRLRGAPFTYSGRDNSEYMADQHYLALYRKYRPRTFDDVKGRDVIVRTIKNQINAGRIGHSYLFCGTRGTGKTTIAKIFAKAVNCENPQDGSPCGVCPSCRAISADASLNVVEMDAASNNGVDDIRNIIDEVTYSPTQGRYRVYIIDEVHMLSTAAFNALLKTLEEPPSYAIFVLATTEPNKLPVTILSRCQRYDFGRLSTETIEDRLKEVAESEQMNVEERALRYIAGAADGSLRDGLSLLDQCAAFNYGNDSLSYEKTLEILGAVDTSVFSRLFEYMHDSDVISALSLLNEIIMQGRELLQFVTDYIWYLRNLMLLKASESTKDSMDISADHLERMIEDARKAEMAEIMRGIRIFSSLVEQIRYSANRKILAEMAIIRMSTGAMESGGELSEDKFDQLNNRIRELEQRIVRDEEKISGAVKSGAVLAPDVHVSSEESLSEPMAGTAQTDAKPKKKVYSAALPEDIKDVVRNWSKYISQLPPGLTRVSLLQAQLSIGDGGKLVVVFSNFVTADHFIHDERYRNRLKTFLMKVTGKEFDIEYKSLDKGEKFTDNYVDLHDVIKMDIETEN